MGGHHQEEDDEHQGQAREEQVEEEAAAPVLVLLRPLGLVPHAQLVTAQLVYWANALKSVSVT